MRFGKRKQVTNRMLEMFAVRGEEWNIEKVNNQTKDSVNIVENAIIRLLFAMRL